MQTSCVIVSTGISPESSFTKWKKDAISIFENIEYTIRDHEIFKVPGERRVYYIFIICVILTTVATKPSLPLLKVLLHSITHNLHCKSTTSSKKNCSQPYLIYFNRKE